MSEYEKLTSLESEQAVCACLLIDGSRFDEVADRVSGNDFFFPLTRTIFQAVEDLVYAGSEVDVITVAEKLQSTCGDNQLDFLTELVTAGLPSTLPAYARIVRDQSVKRALVGAAQSILGNVYSNLGEDSSKAIEFAQSAVMRLSDDQGEALDAVYMKEALQQTIQELDERFQHGNQIRGLSSGLNNLDLIINGFKQGNLVLPAARPSIGKTTFMLQLACDMWTRQKQHGLFFSLEMSKSELVEKSLSCEGHIPLSFLENPKGEGWNQYSSALESAVARLRGTQACIIDCPGIHINQLKSFARKAHKRKPLNFIVVDHIHIMSGDGKTPNEVVSSITKGLKHLAKELNITVFALAQLNRGVENRPDKRPLISDLRDSGSAEQDADIIMLLYREDYYKRDGDGCKPNDGIFEVNVAKFRNGRKSTAYFEHCLSESRIEDTNRQPSFDDNPVQKKYGRAML